MNGNTLTCHRMNKLQPIGVQRLALDILSGAAVQIVAGQGIAQITAVDTNLMRTARMKRDLQQTPVRIRRQPSKIRPSGLTVG